MRSLSQLVETSASLEFWRKSKIGTPNLDRAIDKLESNVDSLEQNVVWACRIDESLSKGCIFCDRVNKELR